MYATHKRKIQQISICKLWTEEALVEVTYYCSFPGNPGNFTNIYNIKYFNRTEWTRSPRRNKIVSFFALLLPYLLHSLLVTQNCLLPFSHGGWHTYRGILLECKIGPLQAGIKSSLRLSDICSIIAWVLEERIAFRPFPWYGYAFSFKWRVTHDPWKPHTTWT